MSFYFVFLSQLNSNRDVVGLIKIKILLK